MTDQRGGERMYGVTVGNGIFVAVGHSGVAYMPHEDERGTMTTGPTDVAPLPVVGIGAVVAAWEAPEAPRRHVALAPDVDAKPMFSDLSGQG